MEGLKNEELKERKDGRKEGLENKKRKKGNVNGTVVNEKARR